MSYFADLARQYIAGEWKSGTGSWDIIDFNPYNGDKLAAITIATVDEVDEAYRAAEQAQRAWAATNPYTRRAVFERALTLIDERQEEITEAIIAELGGTRLKAAFELHLAKEFLREAILLAVRPEGQILPAAADGKENRVYRQPVGVVSVISPFNFPFLLSFKSVAPALALGNAVVLKPHQNTPIVGGSLVAKILEDAGLPPGVLNVVITDIAEIGDAFIEHPVPKVISFTGSDKVGRHVGTVAASHFKRSVLELGGNSALIVLEDADLDYAVDAAVFSRFVHQGQVCMSANRVLVHRAVLDEFTGKFTAKVRSSRWATRPTRRPRSARSSTPRRRRPSPRWWSAPSRPARPPWSAAGARAPWSRPPSSPMCRRARTPSARRSSARWSSSSPSRTRTRRYGSRTTPRTGSAAPSTRPTSSAACGSRSGSRRA